MATGLMWSEVQADPPRCEGSGMPAEPAASLDDGFPDGRAVCPVCLAFVHLVDGGLAEHETWRGDTDPRTASQRRRWFNTHGW